MDAWNAVKGLLPEELSAKLEKYPAAEEIRLRLGRAPTVVTAGRERPFYETPVTQTVLLRVLEKATGASLHAAAPALKNGFITYRGIRIGVCGEAVYAENGIRSLRGFSSIAIRIPHAFPADCDTLIENLLRAGPLSTLIVAPPGVGKTSFLRELIRRAASRPLRVCVIDERNELSASVSGTAQFDLGQGSDILIGVPKAAAAMMLLRGMNPQIIAMDEITQENDLRVIEEICGCGALLFATAHGRNLDDMKKRPLYCRLLESGIFQELVTIRCQGGRRLYDREALH